MGNGESDREESAAHRAIRLSKLGQLHPRDMLAALVDGSVIVPSSQMPELTQGRISAWKPAQLAKPDGSHWVVAFTDQALASAWCDANPEYGFYFEVGTRWLLRALPQGAGIVFNMGTDAVMFQWAAHGVAKYAHDVLGW